MRTNRRSARNIAFIGMLGALSAVLMTINVPLPFAPSFSKFDIAELPALFAGFFMGPTAGVLVILVKIVVKLALQGTETAFVGEFLNLTGSALFVLPASLIYRKRHDKKGAILSLTFATAFVSIAFIFLNAYIGFPMYGAVYGLDTDAIVQMGAVVNPLVHDNLTLMLYGILPFNLIKFGATSLITWAVYKKCGYALRSVLEVPASAKAQKAVRG